MADTLNLIDLDCEASVPYTGISDCPFEIGTPVGMVGVPRGTTFNDADWADIGNVLAAMATEEPIATRAIPIGAFIDTTPGNGDSVKETTEYGFIVKVRDAYYEWTFRIGNDLGYHLQMKALDGKHNTYDFIMFFKNGVIGTTRRNATSGDLERGGFRFSLIDVPNVEFASANKGATYRLSTQMADTDQFNKRLAFQRLDNFDFTDIVGIQEVLMQGTVNSSPAGSVDLSLLTKYGTKSLVDIYGSAVADVTLFEAYNTTTGNTIATTGATIVGDKVRLQADTTDPDYPASASKWSVRTTALSFWVAAGIVGYEVSNTVTVTRP